MGENNREELNPYFLDAGPVLSNSIRSQQNEIAKGMQSRLGVVYDAQSVLLAILSSIHARMDKEFPADEVRSKLHRASIHSTVVQGISLVEHSIATGCYPQAAALVRQEFEAVEACEGLRTKRQKEGKTPRLKVLKHLGPHYGVLSSLAHLSRSDFLLGLNRITESGIDPTLVEGFERELFCLHIMALAAICADAAELRPVEEEQLMNSQEIAWLTSVCGLLEEEGYLTVPRNRK